MGFLVPGGGGGRAGLQTEGSGEPRLRDAAAAAAARLAVRFAPSGPGAAAAPHEADVGPCDEGAGPESAEPRWRRSRATKEPAEPPPGQPVSAAAPGGLGGHPPRCRQGCRQKPRLGPH